MVPTSSATANHRIVSPPKSTNASNINRMVNELESDLPMVSVRARSEITSNDARSPRLVISRILSNTTMVSCTEKLMVVKNAVTKSVSTSTPYHRPKSENRPKTTNKSWTRAIMADMPNLMFLNA